METKPIWRWCYTWPKSNLLEMINEIIAGTFHTNTESSFTRNIDARREILIQGREKGLCSFPLPDIDAHYVLPNEIVLIPQPEMQRGKH